VAQQNSHEKEISLADGERGHVSTNFDVKGKCQSSAATATSKFASKGISAKMRKQILRKYPPAKVKQLHAKLGHIDLRALIKFKRNNKIKALSLPPKLLREYVDDKCPICYIMKRRQPKRPSSLGNAESVNSNLGRWST
jgi:hypothetical protein